MNKNIAFILLLQLSVLLLFGQKPNLKEKALDEFKQEHYTKAISLLEEALETYPEDAEIYYYLAFFNHYRAYDNRPVSGYDFSYSEKIFAYLDKAIELNPNDGDTRYFYGAECSANAFIAMQNYDLPKLKYWYELAYSKGAYPPWLIEFGENFLNSCDRNALLFAGGNADFDICTYLQLCKNFRTDITVIPIGNIDRPWYVQFLKTGLEKGVKKINLNLTDQQIMDIHPFKWDTTTVSIEISPEDRQKFGLTAHNKLQWMVEPDLISERMHSKITGEPEKKRSYLSPQRAILLQIVEDNLAERPIYFSNFATQTFYGGLDLFFQDCGLVSKLIPFPTKGSAFELDSIKLESLLQEKNFQRYASIKQKDIPRISNVTLYAYFSAVLTLADLYHMQDAKDQLIVLMEFYKKYIKIDFKPEIETEVLLKINNLTESKK